MGKFWTWDSPTEDDLIHKRDSYYQEYHTQLANIPQHVDPQTKAKLIKSYKKEFGTKVLALNPVNPYRVFIYLSTPVLLCLFALIKAWIF